MVLAVSLSLLVGCAAMNAPSPQRYPTVRTTTYKTIGRELGADKDGYTFLNDRFRFEFSKEFDGVEGFKTRDERYAIGKKASEWLNGGYDFVTEIFGIRPKKPIRVNIVPAIDGDPGDANTQIQWQTMQGKILDGSAEATMTFGAQAFQRPSVLCHELTHALVSVYTLPAWLDEGLATVVELDYAKGDSGIRERATLTPIGYDSDGYNILETWRGDGSSLPFRSGETYGSAYAIISEIRKRYSADIFVRLFQDFEKTKPHLRGSRLTTKDIIDGLNRVSGKDVRPFFREIKFRVE